MPPGGTLYTVGHSNREGHELVGLLRRHGITLLVDVRRHPGSRRNPRFNRRELASSLESAGIGYRHEEALGGRRSPDGPSPNTAWRSEGFRAYADHALGADFREALAGVLEEARERPTAIMCAEIVPWRCHRRIIADHAVARGWRVVHLIDEGRTEEHELHDAARIDGEGVVYPGPGGDQMRLDLEAGGGR